MLLGKRIRTQDGSDTDYQVIPSPFQAGGSSFIPQDSLSSTSCATKPPGLMLAGGEVEVVEKDVHRGCTSPQSPSPVSHPNGRLREPLSSSWFIYSQASHPSRACLRIHLKLSPTTRPGGPCRLPALERCGTCSDLGHKPNCLDANVNRRTKTGSASLAAERQKHYQELCPK